MKMVTFSNAETEVICGALVDGEIDFPTECLADNTFPVGNADSQELAVLSFPESGSHRILRSAENHDLADNSDHHYEKQL